MALITSPSNSFQLITTWKIDTKQNLVLKHFKATNKLVIPLLIHGYKMLDNFFKKEIQEISKYTRAAVASSRSRSRRLAAEVLRDGGTA